MIAKWFYDNEVVGTGIYKIEIEENKVSSLPVNEIEMGIRIPFKIEQNPSFYQKKINIEPILIFAHIDHSSDKGLIRIAETRPIADPRRNSYFDIPLSLDKMEFLEDLRQGKEISLILNMVCIFAVGSEGHLSASLFPTNVFSRQLELVLTIPKSIWEDNVIPGLGISGLHSVFIRIPPNLRKPFESSLNELIGAVKTFERAASESEFESVVSKARITVESLLNQFPLDLPKRQDGTIDTSYKAKVASLRDQFLSPVIGKTHAKHVAIIMDSLWSPFSGATHPGPSKFNRAYARFSIHQAAAILSIVSDISCG